MQLEEEMSQLADEYLEEGKQAFLENRLGQAALLVQNAMHLFQRAGKTEPYASSLNLMGVIYAATGNENLAVDCYLEGLEAAMEYHYDYLTSMFYNNIGSRYQELGEHEKAIVYFRKSAQELENPACKKEARYPVWCLITYLNLMFSYQELEEYELSEKYLKLAEPFVHMEAGQLYKYTFLISKCRMYWNMGRKEYVYGHLAELMESAASNCNTSDYVQDTRNLCRLLAQMGEYGCWKETICTFERYAKEQDAIYFQVIKTEMWMEYYRTIGEQDRYIDLCVEHAELYRKQKRINDRERAAAIDLKIEIREKEAERKRAEIKSTIDALTGLGNRYLFERDAVLAIEKAIKENERLAVGVLDIDFFKQMNDTYGHITGDSCLKLVSDVLKTAVKGRGQAYRFGGDEFVLLLDAPERESVEETAEMIMQLLRAQGGDNTGFAAGSGVTISQGYACFYPKKDEKRDTLIEHADRALYEVKKNGRNGFLVVEE